MKATRGEEWAMEKQGWDGGGQMGKFWGETGQGHEFGWQWRTGKGWYILKQKSRLDTGVRKSQMEKRKRRKQEGRLHQVTGHSGVVVGVPSPRSPSDPSQCEEAQPTSSEQESPPSPTVLQSEGLSIEEVPHLCPPALPHQMVLPWPRSPYLSQSSPTPQAGRQATPGPSHLFTPTSNLSDTYLQ